MKRVLAGELLDYRDGREGDVAPVRIERLPSGTVRVVVRYPQAARTRALTRMLLMFAAAATSGAIAWRMAIRSPSAWWALPMGLSQFLLTFAIVMVVLWWRAGWVYVFEAGKDGLMLETRGRVYARQRHALRQHVKDVRVVKDRLGRVTAMEIKSDDRLVRGMWLTGIGEQHVRDAT